MILSEEGPNNSSSESCHPVCVDLSLLDSVKIGFSCLTWLLGAFTIKLCLTAFHFFPGTQKCKDSRRNETICTEDSFHAKSESFSYHTWVNWLSACSRSVHIGVSKQKKSFLFQLKFYPVEIVRKLIFQRTEILVLAKCPPWSHVRTSDILSSLTWVSPPSSPSPSPSHLPILFPFPLLPLGRCDNGPFWWYGGHFEFFCFK